MSIRLLPVLFLFGIGFSARAQAPATLSSSDFDRYEPLRCSGSLPEEFTRASTVKYHAELPAIDARRLDRRAAGDLREFALQSHFLLDDLLQSGQVLYNDPVGAYLNDVMARLTGAATPQVRVYVLRSPDVNAFATERGTILVTLGLLARLEDEAQLAFVLAHELAHVEASHARQLFLEGKNIGRELPGAAQTAAAQLVRKNAYCKELELEADAGGLQHFVRAGYDPAAVGGVFDAMKYAALPFAEREFEPSLFEDSLYRLPVALWKRDVKAIHGEDETLENPFSNHPNIAARRQALAAALAEDGVALRGSDRFKVSAARFVDMRQRARFELPLLYLRQDRHAEAIYTAYVLLQDFPASAYLQKCMAKALYLRAKFRNDDDYALPVGATAAEGASERVHALLDTLSARETTVLALHYAWKLHRREPADGELRAIAADLCTELARYGTTLEGFVPAAADSIDTDSTDQYWRAAFRGLAGDREFQNAFADGQQQRDQADELPAYLERGPAAAAWHPRRRPQGSLPDGIKKIVVVDPFYLKLDARQSTGVQYLQTEAGERQLRDLIAGATSATAIEATLLDAAELDPDDSERFNELRLLREWFDDQKRYCDLSATPGLHQAEIDAIAAKYGTDYFLWTGVVCVRERPGRLFGLVPNYEMLFYAVLFDVRRGAYEMLKFEYFDRRDSRARLSGLYDEVFRKVKK
jgi:Zn-dependent protease with chaperone function